MWAEVSKYARVIDCLGQARILAHQAMADSSVNSLRDAASSSAPSTRRIGT
jgi:hypothetical protein